MKLSYSGDNENNLASLEDSEIHIAIDNKQLCKLWVDKKHNETSNWSTCVTLGHHNAGVTYQLPMASVTPQPERQPMYQAHSF